VRQGGIVVGEESGTDELLN